MKLFTEQLDKNNRAFNLRTNKEMEDYLKKFEKDLPKDIVNIIQKLIKYNINDESQIRIIATGSKMDIRALSHKLGVSEDNLLEIYNMMEEVKPEQLDLIPLYINDDDLTSLKKGNKDIADISLDLVSDRGRAQVARKYSNLAISIAAKYRGKSGLDWNALVSAANMGLVKAMNDYKRPTSETNDEQKAKGLSFKQYAGWRIKQQILNDINDFSRTVRRPQYQWDKASKEGKTILNDLSIDAPGKIDDENGNFMDKINNLTVEPDVFRNKDNKALEKIFDLIDNKFSDKTLSIFYSYFGLHGYKKVTGVELSKIYGCSVSAISQHISKVIKFIQGDKSTRGLIKNLLDIYSESLIGTFYNKKLDDQLVKDSLYNMIREVFEYNDKSCWNYKVWECLDGLTTESADVIARLLENDDYNALDKDYDTYESEVRLFVSRMYPFENVADMNDVEILGKMSEIQKHHIIVNS